MKKVQEIEKIKNNELSSSSNQPKPQLTNQQGNQQTQNQHGKHHTILSF